MSKSGGNQVTPADLVAEYGLDAFRYHLLRETPIGSDGDFSYEGVTARYNADLANNLGNLMARVSTVVGSKCAGVGPPPDPDEPPPRRGCRGPRRYHARDGHAAQPHAALEATWRLIHETNAYLETSEPWKAEPGPAVDAVLGSALEALRIVALLVWPAMPDTSTEIWRRLGLSGEPSACRVPKDAVWGGYPGGLTVERGSPLFPRRTG